MYLDFVWVPFVLHTYIQLGLYLFVSYGPHPLFSFSALQVFSLLPSVPFTSCISPYILKLRSGLLGHWLSNSNLFLLSLPFLPQFPKCSLCHFFCLPWIPDLNIFSKAGTLEFAFPEQANIILLHLVSTLSYLSLCLPNLQLLDCSYFLKFISDKLAARVQCTLPW